MIAKPEKKMWEEKAETLRGRAEAAGLRPGRRILAFDGDNKGFGAKARRSGVVLALYLHFFQCDMGGGYKECFRYNLLLGEQPGERVRLQ